MNPFNLSKEQLQSKARTARRHIIQLNAAGPAGGHAGVTRFPSCRQGCMYPLTLLSLEKDQNDSLQLPKIWRRFVAFR